MACEDRDLRFHRRRGGSPDWSPGHLYFGPVTQLVKPTETLSEVTRSPSLRLRVRPEGSEATGLAKPMRAGGAHSSLPENPSSSPAITPWAGFQLRRRNWERAQTREPGLTFFLRKLEPVLENKMLTWCSVVSEITLQASSCPTRKLSQETSSPPGPLTSLCRWPSLHVLPDLLNPPAKSEKCHHVG